LWYFSYPLNKYVSFPLPNFIILNRNIQSIHQTELELFNLSSLP